MDSNFPKAVTAELRARTRAMVSVLRPAPVKVDFDEERKQLPARAREPGIKVTHVMGKPRLWVLWPLVDREIAGEQTIVRSKRALDGAIDKVLARSRELILQSGSPLAETVHARRAEARYLSDLMD